MTVQAHQFAEFFHAAHGHDPFPWQGRLAKRVAGTTRDEDRSSWPECLALPTGGGKTACLDIAVFALACQAAIPAKQRTAPRRILFVVDRRVIVDEAFEHAVELATRLDAATSGILRDVADALRTLGGQSSFANFNDDLAAAPPLTCHQLRGGMYRDEAWAKTPTQPSVICSTVDQIGSRLLFRGYGSSFKAWPVHAGLAANDSLVILDEAHCSQPFLETMQWITRYRGDAWAELPVDTPFAFTIMSATPPAATTDVLQVDESDRQHDILGPRIRASKPATLVVAEKSKGKQALAELASELVGHAAKYAAAGHRRIGILVNRVDTARRVAALLQAVLQVVDHEETPSKAVRDAARALKPVGRFDVELLTGRMRPIDRDDRLKNWQPSRDAAVDSTQTDESPRGLLTWLGTKRNRPDMPWPVFVVATQCLEVGANLDFEALVTECASLDALRQRFGRLNRIARSKEPAPATILIRHDQTPGASQADDPVYGLTLSETWKWLQSPAVPDAATNDAVVESKPPKIIDFGIAAMDTRVATLGPDQRSSLMLQGQNAPVMLPAYIDCWAQTDPEPVPSPNVSLFLHGPQQNAPEIQVCWRADLPRTLRGDGESEITPDDAIAAVAMSPPTTLECMSVPLHVFVKWWRNDGEPASDLSDVSATSNGDDNVGWRNRRLAVVWRGPPRRQRNERNAATSDRVLGTHCLQDQETLRPGDTIVLPVAAGGWEVFGHIPPESLFDVADRCHLLARRRAAIRLHPNLLKYWPTKGSGILASLRDELADLLGATDAPDDRDVYECLERLRVEFESVRDSLPPNEQWLADSLMLLRGPRSRSTKWSRSETFVDSTGGELVPVWQIGLRSKKRWTSGPDAKAFEHGRITFGETESHEDDDSSDTDRMTLTEHSTGVSRHAKAFAAASGLPVDLQRAFELAGDWHDLGKADQRFQAFLFGGSHFLASAADELFAKSAGLRETPVHDRHAARESELPAGFRHELVSLSLLENCAELSRRLEQLTAEQRDLVLHLVTVHHGHGRPFAPIVDDELLLRPKHPEADELLAIDLSRAGFTMKATPDERRSWPLPHRLDSGIAERFWRLVRRYGWWGLAWLESLFVLADHRQSELEASRLGETEFKLEESTR